MDEYVILAQDFNKRSIYIPKLHFLPLSTNSGFK